MTDGPVAMTDHELVQNHRPTARLASRPSNRTLGRHEYRVMCTPPAGQRADLGPWCGSETQAWKSACLRLGLRLHRRA
jgi:hypothetical protein